MSMKLEFEYYKTSILSIHRGMALGKPSNAKPLYLLSIIECIEDGLIIGNIILFDNIIKDVYNRKCRLFEPTIKPAPFYKPYYHSSNDGYYNIKWNGGKIPEHKWHTPSPKIIRENIEYAYLEDGFWKLLQTKENRDKFKEIIISNYL